MKGGASDGMQKHIMCVVLPAQTWCTAILLIEVVWLAAL